ncbi:MAG: thiamine pyrophosphate-dependent dehydrogenase E1 component subunit alpha [Planctomycetia bacterium]|nr:thiamine pyrophosphate-dependent dehydrogenase E1 component subunit alpha [Planctomycetia bacterium]
MLDRNFYRQLYRIRRVEEELVRLYPTDQITSPIHLSIGQEAVSVGVCEALRPSDVVFGTYRSHAYYLAKGGDLRGMIAELYGKATGVAQGKAGSMHLADPDHGVMGASAVVASTIPQAVGYALAMKMRREDRVVVVFFGDGATEEGVFYESLNFAALRSLPILFICENNSYAIHSPLSSRQASPDICRKAEAMGLLAERLETLDIYELYARTCRRVTELRAGRTAPVLIECLCYRWKEHVGPGEDFAAGYRSAGECRAWQQADVLVTVGSRLNAAVRQEIEQSVEEEIREAFAFAQCSPFPAGNELYTDLYA